MPMKRNDRKHREQPSLFDRIFRPPPEQAREARDKAMKQVEENNSHEAIQFEKCARYVIALGKPFTTDDVLHRFPDLEATREKRVFGPVMNRLMKEGLVSRGGYSESDRKTSHARPKRIWKPTS